MQKDIIQRLIIEHQRVQDAITRHKTSKFEETTGANIFRLIVDELLDRKISDLGLRDITDGEKGEKGDKGDPGLNGKDGRDGADGKPGKNGQDGKDGKDGKNLSPKEAKMILAGLLKELKPEDIGALDEEGVGTLLSKFEKRTGKSLEARLNALQDAVMRNYGGHGGSRPFVYDLSPYLNGSTKTFTVDNHSKIISVTSSSAPFTFRPTVDYTDTATSITFDSSIDAPSMLTAGQSIVILMIP